MELHKIKKVSEAEITDAAFTKGRELMSSIEELHGDSVKINSLIKSEEGRIRWVAPGNKNALALEQQLIDAYLSSPHGSVQDNVQLIRNATGNSDSVLYSKPVVKKLSNGTEQLEGVWNIWLSKKQLILGMKKK